MIRIVTLQNYWSKNNFKIGISGTKNTSISENEYQECVEDAISVWEATLKQFVKDNQQYSNLSNIQFDVHRGLDDDDDIRFRWWYSHEDNGRTFFNPLMWEIKTVNIFIAKHNGPIRETMEQSLPTDPIILRNVEQIKSIAIHELGHALGLGHCSYFKDLMFTGGQNQPDPRRKISSLDLQVLSQLFSTMGNQNSTSLTYSIKDTDWVSVQIDP